ncbi:MAG TPA: hypothetical protein VG106_05425, partial [Vicinamibacterales bacterium]|nr:hypothetical protein [Vicinamibacterales bacterium]
RYIARIPRPLRAIAGRTIAAIPKSAWDRTLGTSHNRAGERMHKLARVMANRDDDALYFELVSHWRNLVIGGSEPPLPTHDRSRWPRK